VWCDEDLQRLVGQAWPGAAASGASPRTLWCGSAGLAHALARHLGLAPERQPSLSTGLAAGAASVLFISASHHPVTQRQWSRLLAAWPDAVHVQGADDAALAQALKRMAMPYRLALLDLSPRAPLPAAMAAQRLRAQLMALARAATPPDALVVVGGDTLRAVGHALGAQGLAAGAALRPGWGRARWIGGRWPEGTCHARSGAFGDEDDAVHQVQAVMQLA
jgi:D-threonate/D-erythronate kinase